jgi:RimJ/RimL family protein N-acetyltransferase
MHSGVLISGRSVLLRDRVPDDVETYLCWMTSGEWRSLDAPWEGTRDSMDEQTRNDMREKILELYQQELPEPRSFAFVATRNGIPLGWVNRYSRGSQEHEWCVGIDLCEDAYLNRGFGTEALTLWVDYLFQHSTIHRLALETWSFNPRMARVAENVGFQLEGRLREAQLWEGRWLDKLQYGFLRQEWKPKGSEREHSGG